MKLLDVKLENEKIDSVVVELNAYEVAVFASFVTAMKIWLDKKVQEGKS